MVPMEALDLTEIRARLVADERRIVVQIAALDERAQEAQTPGEIAFSSSETLLDEASLAVDREKELAVRRALAERLADVRRAQQRLDAGVYGRCDSCGAPIPPARLRANPQAALCIACQTAAERRR